METLLGIIIIGIFYFIYPLIRFLNLKKEIKKSNIIKELIINTIVVCIITILLTDSYNLNDIITSLIFGIIFYFITYCVSLTICKKKKLISNEYADIEMQSNNKTTKKCIHCMSEINIYSNVCPICKRSQKNHTALIVCGILAVFLVGFNLFLWFSPSAPMSVRDTLCGLGLRKGEPYCLKNPYDNYDYKIKISVDK